MSDITLPIILTVLNITAVIAMVFLFVETFGEDWIEGESGLFFAIIAAIFLTPNMVLVSSMKFALFWLITATQGVVYIIGMFLST